MAASPARKVVRSYRLVFRRRWRIFKLQNWRIPVPNGIELRAIGYWAACLAVVAVLARLPLIGLAVSAVPPSIRLLALPVTAAWALSRWEVDGRSPHRALLGLIAHSLRPRHLAALRRCPPEGAELVPVEQLTVAPDTTGPDYPHGHLRGPARVLLRYPSLVEAESKSLRPARRDKGHPVDASRWRLRKTATATPLHIGHLLQVPEGKEVIFE